MPYLVLLDPAHGLVAAPATLADTTRETVNDLAARGFAWDSELEAYVRPGELDADAVQETVNALFRHGHRVFWSFHWFPGADGSPDAG